MNVFAVMVVVGVALVLVNHVRAVTAPRTVVEYRYLPRDLDTYIRTATQPSVLFSSMWNPEDHRLRGR